SVRFIGFQTPMVMLSDPEAVRALYTARDSGLPPGRTLGLRPVMGPRSILLLEGQEHLARRKLMLPPFHGERMRAYEDVIREVAEHRADPASTERDDILAQLMAATFEDGGRMSDSELRDQLVTLLLAGHETTATALAWTFDLLLRHPAQLARLRTEVERGAED